MSMRYYDIHTHSQGETANNAIVSIAYSNATPTLLDSIPHLSLSLHPWESHLPQPSIEEMHSLATHPHVVAIGECGIDTTHTTTAIDIQEKLFIAQIELAEQVQKPLIIHCVRAFDRVLHLHKRFAPHQPWIIHGFRGKPTLAQQLQQQGIYLSIGERFNPDTLTTLNPSLTLVESDTSLLPIEKIYRQIASNQNIAVERLIEQTEENIRALFSKISFVK